jgi:hypothetical protein
MVLDSDNSDNDFALASSVQLAFLIDWDSDSSDEEDLVDYRTLPRSTRHSFDHDCTRYCFTRDTLIIVLYQKSLDFRIRLW